MQNSDILLYFSEMATVTDATTTAIVSGDLNAGATGLPTVVPSVVNPLVALAVPGGPLNHHKGPKKFTGVNFNR